MARSARRRYGRGMAYQHPLAYTLGLEGVALLRAFAGDYDRAFVEARIAEVRRLLDSPAMRGDGITAAPVDTVAGYRVWSRTYDEPGNGRRSPSSPGSCAPAATW
jgi:hypothetical protein